MRLLPGHKKGVRCLVYAHDGRSLLSGGTDGSVRQWDLASGAETVLFQSKPKRAVLALALSPDGKHIAWGCGDTAYLWDVAAAAVRDRFPGHEGSVTIVAFSADGQLLAVTTKRFGQAAHWGQLRWWDVAGGMARDEINERVPAVHRPRLGNGVWTVAFSPDETRLAVCLADLGVVVLRWPKCEEERKYQGMAHSLAFSADGEWLAGRSDSNTIWLMNPRGSAKGIALKAHQKWVKSVAFSPDSRVLASGGTDSTVRLWDVATQKERACFEWQIGAIWSVEFAPDGMTAACGGETGIVVFDVDPG